MVTAPGRKPYPQFYEEKAATEWQQVVADMAMLCVRAIPVQGEGQDFTLPTSGRVLITVRFNMPKPVSYPKSVVHHVRKPDLDNLVKAVLDGLVKGRILEDDNCVTDMMVIKRYAEPGHPEGVEVDLTALPV